MTAPALALVLAAAAVHASWNLLAKRSGGGAPFVWLVSLTAAILYAPAAGSVLVSGRSSLGRTELAATAVSAALHAGYFLTLQRGYRHGDLSLVYPLARGTGPLLSVTLAVVLLGERPTALAAAGAFMVVVGSFVLTGGQRLFQPHADRAAAAYGVATGAFVAGYTLWDKHVVAVLGLSPLVFDWLNNVGRALLLTPLAVPRWHEVRACWSRHRGAVLGVGLLSPLSYILVLTAMVFTPVSYVAPAREISVLIGTAMGARLLSEAETVRRLTGAGAVVLGVVALAVG